ncbi:hypothetical protein K502DRAFT_32639 [Neoconidiobolus thromboides FSU 785]|nr:hypothetical protein K502DRAFT_32639 [Neoconidiobolus thromboides FSU 785]
MEFIQTGIVDSPRRVKESISNPDFDFIMEDNRLKSPLGNILQSNINAFQHKKNLQFQINKDQVKTKPIVKEKDDIQLKWMLALEKINRLEKELTLTKEENELLQQKLSQNEQNYYHGYWFIYKQYMDLQERYFKRRIVDSSQLKEANVQTDPLPPIPDDILNRKFQPSRLPPRIQDEIKKDLNILKGFQSQPNFKHSHQPSTLSDASTKLHDILSPSKISIYKTGNHGYSQSVETLNQDNISYEKDKNNGEIRTSKWMVNTYFNIATKLIIIV